MLIIFEPSGQTLTHTFTSDAILGPLYVRNLTTDQAEILLTITIPSQAEAFTTVHYNDADVNDTIVSEDILIDRISGTLVPSGTILTATSEMNAEFLQIYTEVVSEPTQAQMTSALTLIDDIKTINTDMRASQAAISTEATLVGISALIGSRITKCNTDSVTIAGTVPVSLPAASISNNLMKVKVVEDDVASVTQQTINDLLSGLTSLRSIAATDVTLTVNHVATASLLGTISSKVDDVVDAVNSMVRVVNVSVPPLSVDMTGLLPFEDTGSTERKALTDTNGRIILSPDTLIGIDPIAVAPGTTSVSHTDSVTLGAGESGLVFVSETKMFIYNITATTGNKQCKLEILQNISGSDTVKYTEDYTTQQSVDDFTYEPPKPAIYRDVLKVRITNTSSGTIQVYVAIEYEGIS